MKRLLFILILMVPVMLWGQKYSVQNTPVCWSINGQDSSLTRYVLTSARGLTVKVLLHLNADGQKVNVGIGGLFSNGFCECQNTGSGGGGPDGDWAFISGSTIVDPVYRTGHTNIFTQANTHGFRVDSTFQFNMDGVLSVFDWQDGNDVQHDKGLLFRSSVAGASTAGIVLNDDNKFTIGSMAASVHRRRLGVLSFGGLHPTDGRLRHSAFISANVDDLSGWTSNSFGTEMGFYVTNAGDTIPNKVLELERDGRIYFNRYSLFNDGLPVTLLGNSSGTGPVSHHYISGTPSVGKGIFINGSNELEWQTPASGQIDTLIGGNDISIDNTNPNAPIINSLSTDDQLISISNDTIYLEDGGFIVLPADNIGTDDQVLSISNDTIYLEDGGFVVLPPAQTGTDDQVISISNDTIYLEDGGFIVLLPDDTGTDDQLIGISSDTIYLEDGGFIVLPPDDTGTDDQLITISNDTIYLEDGGFIVLPPDDIGTDDQLISISNDTIYLEDGGFLVLPPDDTGTDDQLISISNDTIYLEDGGFIVLPPDDTGTDDQLLTISNDTIYLEDGGFVVLPSITDDQIISISNDTIYLEDGGFVVLPSNTDTNIYNSNGSLPSSTIRTIGFGNNLSRYRYLDPDNADQYFDLFNNSLNSGEAGLYILDDDNGSSGYLGEIDYGVFGVKTDFTASVKGSFASLINSNADAWVSVENTSDLVRLFSTTSDYRIGNPGTATSLLQKNNTLISHVMIDQSTGNLYFKEESAITTAPGEYAHSENVTSGAVAVTSGFPQNLNSTFSIVATSSSSNLSYNTTNGRWTYSGSSTKNFFVTLKIDVTTSAKLADLEMELNKNHGSGGADYSYGKWVTSSDGDGQHTITTNMIFSLSNGDYINTRFESGYSVDVTIQNYHLSIVEI